MRLIDADALRADVIKILNNSNCGEYDGAYKCFNAINKAPTADMRQGKWTDVIAMNNTLIYGCCDQCHLPSPVSLYCGSCGAKMTAPYNSVDVTDIMRSITKGQG